MTVDPNTPLESVPSTPIPRNLRPPDNTAAPPATLDGHLRPQGRRYTGIELWLHRITVLMFVFFCASAGVLLVILPWRPEWTDNHLLLGNPSLRAFVGSGFFRGVCSGLGVLDIWIGFWEAIHYHEERRP